MVKRYSISAAQRKLAPIILDLDTQERVELTRQGKPVAVLLSTAQYRRISRIRTDFWKAFTAFRASTPLRELSIEPDWMFDTRDGKGQ